MRKSTSLMWFITILVATSCSGTESTRDIDAVVVETADDSLIIDTTITVSEIRRFNVVKTDSSIAEAAASFGCIGENRGAPMNLPQHDDDPTFEKLFYLSGRPWYVKIEQAGLASGRLYYSAGAEPDENITKSFLREYDLPMDAFTIATILDQKWSILSTLWQDSLGYALKQYDATNSVTDSAYATLAAYGSAVTSACKIALEGSILQASEFGFPLSSYLYIQLIAYLQEWYPDHFTKDGLTEFEEQFNVAGE